LVAYDRRRAEGLIVTSAGTFRVF